MTKTQELSDELGTLIRNAELMAALERIRKIKDQYPFDAAGAATACIAIAKEALGEK